MFREARRQNRILNDQVRIKELLITSEYGFLCVGMEENGYPYGVPISYVYDEETNSLFFHCALEGQKLEILSNNNKVSFCIVGKTTPISKQFTTLYESVIIFGDANLKLTDDEKRKSLQLLVKKYSSEHIDSGEDYMNQLWNRTLCLKIEIKHISAKAKY